MCAASQERSRESISKSKATALESGHELDPVTHTRNAADAPASLRRLTSLLSAEAVDLARVSGEIRAQPDL